MCAFGTFTCQSAPHESFSSLCTSSQADLERCKAPCRVEPRSAESVRLSTQAPKRTHFRASPLSFYTLDDRNNAHFDGGRYGLRLSWLWSSPPSPGVMLPNGTLVAWQRSGAAPLRKIGWPSALRFSVLDLALPANSKQRVRVGDFAYDLLIPSIGDNHSADILFLGDVNINEDGLWGKTGTAQVIRDVLRSASAPMALFGGDIFYHDDSFIEAVAWPALDQGSGRGISDHLVVALPGNHDYEQSGCVYCSNWQSQGPSRKCMRSSSVNAFWVPLFFASDGSRPFWEIGDYGATEGCAVPLEFTLQVVLAGRTAVLTGDNVWPPEALNALVNWDAFARRLRELAVRALIVTTHWNVAGLGAVSSAEDWTIYVASRLSGKVPDLIVLGNTNHVHRNAVERWPEPRIMSSGQNGMRDWSSPEKECRGSQCCPSMWLSSLVWKTGGWRAGEVCGDLFPLSLGGFYFYESALETAKRKACKDEFIYTHAPPFLSDMVLVPLTSSDDIASAASPLRTVSLPLWFDHDPSMVALYLKVYNVSRGFPSCNSLAMMDIPFDPGFTCWTYLEHPMSKLRFPADELLSLP